MILKHTGEWIGSREEQCRCGSGGFSLAGEPIVRPQVEEQPMNPFDTVQVSEEVGVEGEFGARPPVRLQHNRHAEKYRNTH